MVVNPCLGVAADCARSGEYGIALRIGALIFQDAALIERAIHDLADTPAGVKEVEQVLHVEA